MPMPEFKVKTELEELFSTPGSRMSPMDTDKIHTLWREERRTACGVRTKEMGDSVNRVQERWRNVDLGVHDV